MMTQGLKTTGAILAMSFAFAVYTQTCGRTIRQERVRTIIQELRGVQARTIIGSPAMQTWYRVRILDLTAVEYTRHYASQLELADSEEEWFDALATLFHQSAGSVLSEDDWYKCLATQYIEFYGLENIHQMDSHVSQISDENSEWHRNSQIRNLREFDRLIQRKDIQALQELSDEWERETDARRESNLRQAEGWMASCSGAGTP